MGVAECIRIAPHAFALNDEQLSVFRPSGPWTRDDLEEARESCPTSAIRLGADGSGE